MLHIDQKQSREGGDQDLTDNGKVGDGMGKQGWTVQGSTQHEAQQSEHAGTTWTPGCARRHHAHDAPAEDACHEEDGSLQQRWDRGWPQENERANTSSIGNSRRNY